MDTPDDVVSELLYSASANHDRLKRLEDVIASLSKTMADTPAPQQTNSHKTLKTIQAAFAAWRPVMIAALLSTAVLLAVLANIAQTLTSYPSAHSAVQLQLFLAVSLSVFLLCGLIAFELLVYSPKFRLLQDNSPAQSTSGRTRRVSSAQRNGTNLTPESSGKGTTVGASNHVSPVELPSGKVARRLFQDNEDSNVVNGVTTSASHVSVNGSVRVITPPGVDVQGEAKVDEADSVQFKDTQPVDDGGYTSACAAVDAITAGSVVDGSVLQAVSNALGNPTVNNNPTQRCGLLWRRARLRFLQSKYDAPNAQWLIDSGLADAQSAVHADTTIADAHKWLALLLTSAAEAADPATKVKYGHMIRDHAHTALRLNPHDPVTHFMLGRWCFAVAEIPSAKRWIASSLYGDLPTATFQEALEQFQAADLKLKNKRGASDELKRALTAAENSNVQLNADDTAAVSEMKQLQVENGLF